MIFATIAVTILPCLLIFFYIYTHDEHPEPKGLIAKVALAGALSAIPVLMFVGAIRLFGAPSDPLGYSLTVAFLWAAIPEELFKLLMVYSVAYKRPEFDEPFDGIIYGTASSLGFAMLENVLYVSQHGMNTAILRAFTAIPMHLFCGATMGYFIGRAKFVKSGKSNAHLWLLAFMIPMIIHGLYDASIFYAEATSEPIYLIPGAGTLILVIVLGILLMRRLERRNFQILSSYYDIPEQAFHQHLPKGIRTERKLPQMLAFFREASASSSGWAAPVDFHQQFEQKFGPVDQHYKEPLPSRGFLGFLFSLMGILVAGLGGLMVIAGVQSLTDNLKQSPLPVGHGLSILGLSAFLVLNGILLYLKGFFRNRKKSPGRSILAQLFIVLGNLGVTVALLVMSSIYEHPEKNDSFTPWVIIGGISLAIWLWSFFGTKKKAA